jgi:hypothetical protein
MNTAIPHAQVITIHPEFCAFDLFNRTPATTPSPNRIRVAVPTTSPRYGFGTAMLPTTPFWSRAVAPAGPIPVGQWDRSPCRTATAGIGPRDAMTRKMFDIVGHRAPDDAGLTQVVQVEKVAAVTTG